MMTIDLSKYINMHKPESKKTLTPSEKQISSSTHRARLKSCSSLTVVKMLTTGTKKKLFKKHTERGGLLISINEMTGEETISHLSSSKYEKSSSITNFDMSQSKSMFQKVRNQLVSLISSVQ